MVSVLEELLVADAEDWRAWLDRHHGESPGVWLVLAKKGKTDPTALTYDEALLEALCYGWIDGQVRRRDGESYRQRFTPRRQRSIWSARNVALAERLLAEGRMRPAGKAAIERAHNDGSWEKAYAGPGTRRRPVPAVFNSTLPCSPAARASTHEVGSATFTAGVVAQAASTYSTATTSEPCSSMGITSMTRKR
jgi:uncharacterized protein YdeI (YjbR/CyaY-like superfamily)